VESSEGFEIVYIEIGKTTSDELARFPAGTTAAVKDFVLEQEEALCTLMQETLEIVATNHLKRAMQPRDQRDKPLMAPVMYVIGTFQELGTEVIYRLHKAGLTFVESDQWPKIVRDLSDPL
jgi:hypothetical protein